MNEDIKKYEANKGKSREEILQAEKTNKKRTTYIHWIVTFSLIIDCTWPIPHSILFGLITLSPGSKSKIIYFTYIRNNIFK